MNDQVPHEGSLSVIIPAYNEGSRIGPTLGRISAYLREYFNKFEIIVVDDGSTDNTPAVVGDASAEIENIRIIRYSPNAGKGHAVKQGVLSSTGSYVLMSDADLSTPIEEAEKLLAFIEGGFDIAIGSRALPESDIAVRQPWYREAMGKTFNLFVRTLVMGGLSDTQCGFKLFRGDVARSLFARSRIKGFSFDVEILYLARQAGYDIKEVPIRWLNSPHSRVTLIRDPVQMFFDLLRIRLYWIFGKYR